MDRAEARAAHSDAIARAAVIGVDAGDARRGVLARPRGDRASEFVECREDSEHAAALKEIVERTQAADIAARVNRADRVDRSDRVAQCTEAWSGERVEHITQRSEVEPSSQQCVAQAARACVEPEGQGKRSAAVVERPVAARRGTERRRDQGIGGALDELPGGTEEVVLGQVKPGGRDRRLADAVGEHRQRMAVEQPARVRAQVQEHVRQSARSEAGRGVEQQHFHRLAGAQRQVAFETWNDIARRRDLKGHTPPWSQDI